jgi:hypothetical protein
MKDMDERMIQIRCYKRDSSAGSEVDIVDPLTSRKLSLSVDASDLDVEKILVAATECCAKAIIQRLHDTLLGYGQDSRVEGLIHLDRSTNDRKRKRKSAAFGPTFKESDIHMNDFSSNTAQALKTSSNPFIDVNYISGRTLRISADIRTGKVIVTEGGIGAGLLSLPLPSDTQVSAARETSTEFTKLLRVTEEKINESPSNVINEILHLRYEIIMEQVVSLCVFLGLELINNVNFIGALKLDKLSDLPLKHFALFKFASFQDFYLVIAVNSLRAWLGEASMSSAVDIEGDLDEPRFRGWIFSIRFEQPIK